MDFAKYYYDIISDTPINFGHFFNGHFTKTNYSRVPNKSDARIRVMPGKIATF